MPSQLTTWPLFIAFSIALTGAVSAEPTAADRAEYNQRRAKAQNLARVLALLVLAVDRGDLGVDALVVEGRVGRHHGW